MTVPRDFFKTTTLKNLLYLLDMATSSAKDWMPNAVWATGLYELYTQH